MNLSSFTSFFKKKSTVLKVPDSILVKKLKNLSQESTLLVFKDTKIYHHTKAYNIPLIMLDPLRGIYIFESKEWTYDELKNADIQKADNQDSSKDTLAFDNTHSIIRKKFNELTHNDGVPIFNFLLMENLNADEYEHLTDSFKKLVPSQKIIFGDSNQEEIFKKLQKVAPEDHQLPSSDEILGTILIQYTILSENGSLHFANKEQRKFIDSSLHEVNFLNAAPSSGKTSLLLLKSLIELFTNPEKRIIILKPTTLACETLKKRLLDIVEHAIIEIDLTFIEIITPLELLNRHQTKLGRPTLHSLLIDQKLMSKNFSAASIIMLDDAGLYSNNFVDYLLHIQKNSKLLLVNSKRSETAEMFSQNFRQEHRVVKFHHTNPHAKALHLIAKLSQNSSQNIVVVSNTLTMQKLKDDLEHFIEDEPTQIDSSEHFINQKLSNLRLCTYIDTNMLQTNHIILMDLCFVSENEIEYAFNLADKSVNVLYEEDCQEINNLRNKYESDKERTRVEGTTES